MKLHVVNFLLHIYIHLQNIGLRKRKRIYVRNYATIKKHKIQSINNI